MTWGQVAFGRGVSDNDGVHTITSGGQSTGTGISSIFLCSAAGTRWPQKFFPKLLKGLSFVPRAVITDKLKSYGAAQRECVWNISAISCGNAISHQPTRQQERRLQGFNPVMPSAFCRRMVRFPNISARRHGLSAPPRPKLSKRLVTGRSDLPGFRLTMLQPTAHLSAS